MTVEEKSKEKSFDKILLYLIVILVIVGLVFLYSTSAVSYTHLITFHSLEDRIVKTIFKRNENPCTCPPGFPVCVCGNQSKGKVITRKPILPSEEELEMNKRSKSAKLRVFERVKQ